MKKHSVRRALKQAKLAQAKHELNVRLDEIETELSVTIRKTTTVMRDDGWVVFENPGGHAETVFRFGISVSVNEDP